MNITSIDVNLTKYFKPYAMNLVFEVNFIIICMEIVTIGN